MCGRVGWGQGPRAAEGRSHSGVSVGRTLHATLRGLDFVHLTVRSQRRLLLGVTGSQLCLGSALRPSLETLPLLWSSAQMS